jgi:hypothetical protein
MQPVLVRRCAGSAAAAGRSSAHAKYQREAERERNIQTEASQPGMPGTASMRREALFESTIQTLKSDIDADSIN